MTGNDGRLGGELLGRYRTLPARIIGGVMVSLAVVLGAFTLADVVQGRTDGLTTGLALIVAVAVAAWVLFLRPSVRLHSDGVVMENVVRDVTVPFAAVEEITHDWALELNDHDGRRHSAWAVPVKRERTPRGRVDDFAETTRRRGSAGASAQGVADEVHRAFARWREQQGADTPPPGTVAVTRRWAPVPLAALAVAAGLFGLAVLG